ncbi:hypothetical protein [Microcoleus sp. OTE_8_concoct_300]|uniref:hypothetical protein n=1 Tax=Microcoleus sp. OTE_8_concoct_300 TaxID=2964710 RepID=UPI00403F70CC
MERSDRNSGIRHGKGAIALWEKRAIPYGIATHARTLKKQQLRYAQNIIRLD